MSKRSLKPISKEKLKQVIGSGDLPPPPPLDPNIPRGGWIVPADSTDSPKGSW